MSWSSPKTWTAALVSVADLNQEIRDNLKAGFPTDTAFTSYSPTDTNFTVGNGTLEAFYCQVGELVVVQHRITFGSTTSVDGTQPTWTLPVSESSDTIQPAGVAVLHDSGVAFYYAAVLINAGSGNFYYRALNTSSTYLNTDSGDDVTSSVPFTWTTNDTIRAQFCYRAD